MKYVKSVGTAVLSLGMCSLVLVGCTTDQSNAGDRPEQGTTLDDAAGTAGSVASTVGERAGSLFDDAKVRAFIVAFRAQYGALAENRDDNAIKNLLMSTCTEIASGTDESSVVADLELEAASGDARPSTEQAQRIFDQAELACP
ncbi:hypothetical protein QMK17_25670 [Rhodococcus sp. G-MC3]|uniref:hypothetical protein n=1 Tax=Rhodococcus sp. G-MC3 TaxID=3046209 RepID=UPI0024B9378A|nr:hypothetical protein [Rhodococcus sp. G-MC3]MDJ0396684.1 hypothetical protein [Rhodococcus sp. G-MC3]